MTLYLYLISLCLFYYQLLSDILPEWCLLAISVLIVALYYLAQYCYEKTIRSLREGIEDLRKEIESMKE